MPRWVLGIAPWDDWTLLDETLGLDMESGAIDSNLRAAIRRASEKQKGELANAAEAREFGKIMDVSPGPGDEFEVFVMPASQWEVLAETLEMDIRSGFFDPDLRKDIEKAYGNVKIMYTDKVQDARAARAIMRGVSERLVRERVRPESTHAEAYGRHRPEVHVKPYRRSA
jgi:hypothetical protein